MPPMKSIEFSQSNCCGNQQLKICCICNYTHIFLHFFYLLINIFTGQNLPSFLKAGFIGAGIGSNLTDRRLIQAGDYQGLKALAEEFMAAAGL